MTTLDNRPNSATPRRRRAARRRRRGSRSATRSSRTSANLVEKARQEPYPVVWGAAQRRGTRERQRRVADRLRAEPRRGRAAHREELRRLLRGHPLDDGVLGARRRKARRRRRADRSVHPLDAPRRIRARLRRDARQRRATRGDRRLLRRRRSRPVAHTNLYWTNQSAPGRTPGPSRRRTSTSERTPCAGPSRRRRTADVAVAVDAGARGFRHGRARPAHARSRA